MNLIFMGTPAFAIPSLELLVGLRHNIQAVVTQPDKPKGRGARPSEPPVKKLAIQCGLPLFQPEYINRDEKTMRALEEMSPGLIVTAAFGQILSERILSIPKYGGINVHASLLPKYRGAAPINRAIINGDDTTGISIIKMVEALDAGDIIEQSILKIYPDETADELEKRLAHHAVRPLKSVIDSFENGSIRYTPQDESLVTYAKKLKKEDGVINWNCGTKRIHDLVRGLTPWPSAFSSFFRENASAKERVIIKKTQIGGGCEKDRNRPPGEIIEISSNGLLVSTNDGCIWIIMLQPEGKRVMSAVDYVNGHDVKVGDHFV